MTDVQLVKSHVLCQLLPSYLLGHRCLSQVEGQMRHLVLSNYQMLDLNVTLSVRRWN